jgi:three-Cys-motif partner protein
MINHFGGSWTERKMEIVVSYAKAYLTIMQAQSWAKTLYFDGFAGSGSIADDESKEGQVCNNLWGEMTSSSDEIKKGTALRILEITEPKPFDMYYFVEKNESHQKELKSQVAAKFSTRNAHVVKDDCNVKLVEMAKFLTKNKTYRALVFIDPYGMSVKWSSIEALKNLGVDLWILVPTGVGANRVLVNDGEIPEAWLTKLEDFLGTNRIEIKKHFYKEVKMHSLFYDGEQTIISKEKDAVNKLGKLYSERLKQVFNHVSEPFVMRNSMNSIMYHFFMATNNKSALKIANDVIKPKYKL